MASLHPAFVFVLYYLYTVEAALLQPRRPCVPTSAARGPCHECMCTVDGVYHCRNVTCRTVQAQGYWNESNSLPEIREGDPCVKGKVYRMECNTCQCHEHNSLVCTKMACLHASEIKKLTLKYKKRPGLREGLAELPVGDCIPGTFYKKGCRKCFCEDSKKAECSTTNNCKDSNSVPRSPTALRSYGSNEFEELPALSHQAAACKSGVTYRVDCNTCFCLANGNLACEKLLCPSYDDVNRLNAKNMSGTPCKAGDTSSAECIKCTCKQDKLECLAESGCIPHETRKQMHGSLSSQNKPLAGVKARDHLDLKEEECIPGMVYREGCNKCYCQKDQSVRCTQKTCLKFSQVVRLKKLRLHLEKNGL